ncbi:MAG: hypothetical protein RR998_00965 [Oscillospiraceae bacterium]
MKKNIALVILALMCVLALAACSPAAPPPAETPVESTTPDETNQTIGLPNPVVEVASYEELQQNVPGAAIVMPPKDAAAVRYSYIKNTDGSIMLAQINFSYNANTYTYRCALCKDEAGIQKIDGMNYTFTHTETVELPDGVKYKLETYDAEGAGVATWYSAVEQCQYSLSTITSADAATVIKDVVPLLASTNASV